MVQLSPIDISYREHQKLARYPLRRNIASSARETVNFLAQQRDWEHTAVVIMYGDSDGWYDHQMGPIVNQSSGPADTLTDPNARSTASIALPGVDPGNAHALGRCGYGPRQPLLVISPRAQENFVDHTTIAGYC